MFYISGIFKLFNKSQPLDVPALQQIIMKLDSALDEVGIYTTLLYGCDSMRTLIRLISGL